MAIEALEGLTDEQLFSDANADEAPADTVVAETVEPAAEQQTRDEAGRFAGKPETEPAAATDQPAKTPVDDNAAMVPSWRVREINEEKRTLADRLAALEADKANWQRRAAERPKLVEKAETPDPLLDPDGYKAAIREEIRQERLAEVREDSLQRAREANPRDFDEAFAAAQMAVDPALKARMQSSRDPGKTLLEWHRDNKTRQEIGGDLTAYKQRLREEALKDPEFRKAAMTAWQAEVQPSNGRQPRVELPPSLTRATSAAANAADDDDISNDGLWRHANA